jgi:hypothetical protein
VNRCATLRLPFTYDLLAIACLVTKTNPSSLNRIPRRAARTTMSLPPLPRLAHGTSEKQGSLSILPLLHFQHSLENRKPDWLIRPRELCPHPILFINFTPRDLTSRMYDLSRYGPSWILNGLSLRSSPSASCQNLSLSCYSTSHPTDTTQPCANSFYLNVPFGPYQNHPDLEVRRLSPYLIYPPGLWPTRPTSMITEPSRSLRIRPIQNKAFTFAKVKRGKRVGIRSTESSGSFRPSFV